MGELVKQNNRWKSPDSTQTTLLQDEIESTLLHNRKIEQQWQQHNKHEGFMHLNSQ